MIRLMMNIMVSLKIKFVYLLEKNQFKILLKDPSIRDSINTQTHLILEHLPFKNRGKARFIVNKIDAFNNLTFYTCSFIIFNFIF